MEEHVHEELIVVETNAVGNPWAVMVHFQYALIALRAMMATIRFGFKAPLADANVCLRLLLVHIDLHVQD